MTANSGRTSKGLRVAIVGAGPAGLTIAYHLTKLGVENITVFERASDVGGQSVTIDVDGVPVELGTCYLAAGYVMIRSIAREIGCAVELLPPATVLDERGRELEHGAPSTSAVLRFIARWLGWYARGQMQRPTAPDNAEPFSAWLDARGLGALAGEFTFSAGLTAQLYGPLPVVSAHNALFWMRPSLFVTGRLSKTYAMPAGFQSFWRQLARRLPIALELGREVTAVVPGEHGPTIRFKESDERPRSFDHVFVACPLDAFDHPLRATLARHDAFAETTVYSAAWRGRGWPAFAPSRCYMPACSDGAPGRVLTVRRFAETNGRAVGQLCAYALPDRAAEEHRDTVIADLREIVGLQEVEIVEDRTWRYNLRYSSAQLRDGLPGVIAAAQGRGGVWYTGGALSHWDVDAITDFNHALARTFARAVGFSWWRRLRLRRLDEPVRDL